MDSDSRQNILAGLVGTSPIGGRLEANGARCGGGANSAISSSLGGGSATPGMAGRQHKLKQRFTVIKKLGKGTYGKVQLAINKSTGQEVAIKTIKKSKIESPQDLERVRREIQIMSSIEHPHIIHIYEVFENKDKIVLVMQYAPGGELYEYVSEQKVLEEAEARRLFRQIATAIYYCHRNKICHRDLKLENILLDEKNNAKIADFGLSNVFDKRRQLKTFCGSPLYASPEIVQGSPYEGPEVDCWSLGVLLYTLVYGAMPFDGSNFKRLVKQISESAYFEPKQKSQASPLIGKLLCADPNKRATIVDVCSDAWVNGLSISVSPSSPKSPTSTLPSTSLLQVAQDMANLTPVRFDILLALVPPSSPPSLASERPPLATRSNLLDILSEKNPIKGELDESGDVGVDGHSPVASYIVRDLTEKMDEEKENEEQTVPVQEPQTASKEPKAQSDDLKKPLEEEEPMEVEQPKEEEMVTNKVDVPLAPPKEEEWQQRGEKEEEKVEVKIEEPTVQIDVEPMQSPLKQPDENEAEEVRAEVEQQVEDIVEKTTALVEVPVVPVQVDPQKEEENAEVKAEGEQKPVKKVKKKIVVVKKKKKVSTKRDDADRDEAVASSTIPSCDSKGDKSKADKIADERTSSTSTSTSIGSGIKKSQQQVAGERVGKVKIPETFSLQQGSGGGGESPPVLSKGALETRRQSALVADVAQKLLLAAQGGSPSASSELRDDMPSLASVRVSETKGEFERRASLAAAAAASLAKEAAVQSEESKELLEPEELQDAKTLRELLDILDQSAVLEPARVASPKEAEMLVVSQPKGKTTSAFGEKTVDERSDSVETVKAQEQLESRMSHDDVQPMKMAPITRSYKKVTFTKDGACITETGRIYSTRGEDGTLRRVERKSKVTHFPSSTPDGHREEVSQEEEVTSYGGEIDQDLHGWQQASTSSRPFEKLIMPSSRLFDSTGDDDDFTMGRGTGSAMSHHRPSSRGEFRRTDSKSSCSSGSTDAFDDIFDTWTGAISMFSKNNWPSSNNFNSLQHNSFRPLSSLFGTTRHRRHHQSTSNSPRCASADVGAGPSWPNQQQQQAPRDQQQQLNRPPNGWSPHSSGYDSDAPLDRPASAMGVGPSGRRPKSSLFGSSQQLQSLFQQQPSSSSLGVAAMLQAQPADLARSLAAEHKQLKRRLDRQHHQLWKGSSPSLFDDQINDNTNLEDEVALFPPLPDLFGSTLKGQREKSPSVTGRPPRPGPSSSSSSSQQQHLVEQSQSSSSFTSKQLRHSVALDLSPRRFQQQQQQQSQTQVQVERSSSLIRSQLANLQLTSSATGESLPNNASNVVTKPATFIQLKRTSSIKRMETQQHQEQIKSKSNTGSIRSTAFFELASSPQSTQEVVRSRQAEVENKKAAEERVQHWLQDNSAVNTSSGGNLSQSSASKTTSSASLQSAATTTSQNNIGLANTAATASQFNKHSVTSFATSSSSKRRIESQQQDHQFAKSMSKQEVFSARKEFKVTQGCDPFATAPVMSEAQHNSSKLEWISQSQNDLLNSMMTTTIEGKQQELHHHETVEESGSLLDQLRSRGYKSLINRRMVAGEQQVSSSSSSLINNEMIGQNISQQSQVQRQHVSTTSSTSSSGAGSGGQRLIQQQQQQHFTTSIATKLIQPLDEEQQEDFQQQELNILSSTPKTLASKQQLDSSAPPLYHHNEEPVAKVKEDEAEEREKEDEEDEDVREAKRNIKAYVERMRETELFLKAMQQVEEEQSRRQREQSFLFDNLMFSASRFVETGTGIKQQPLNYIDLPAEVGEDEPVEWFASRFGSSAARGSCSAPIKPATSGNILANGYLKPSPTSQAYLSPSSPPISYLSNFSNPLRGFGGSKLLMAANPLEPVQPVQQVPFNTHYITSDTTPMNHRQNFRRSKSQLSDQFTHKTSFVNHSPHDFMQNMDPVVTRRPLSMRLTREDLPVAPGSRLDGTVRSRRSLSQVRWPSLWAYPSSASTSEYRSAYCQPHKVPIQTNGAGTMCGDDDGKEDNEDEDEMSEYRASTYVPKVMPQGAPPPLHQIKVERVGRSQQRIQRGASPYHVSGSEQAAGSHRRKSLQQPTSPARVSNTTTSNSNTSDATRRLSTSKMQESSSSSSRLTELEQRIQENKRRRQQLLSGESTSSSSPSAINRDNKVVSSDDKEQDGESSPVSTRQTIRLTSRPSRLESMEARIKRRSYCVQVAGECSPERRSGSRRGSFQL